MTEPAATFGSNSLPEAFKDLEPFADWILATERERNLKRLKSDYADIKCFYDAMLLRKEAWLAHLDKFSLKDMPDPERRLYHLALSLMEVAPAVEYFQSPDLLNAVPAERLNILSPSYR